MKLVLSHH